MNNAKSRRSFSNSIVQSEKEFKYFDKNVDAIVYPPVNIGMEVDDSDLDCCLETIIPILRNGLLVIIDTVPKTSVVKRLCKDLRLYSDRVILRFAICSADDSILRLWEPNRPNYEERKTAIELAWRSKFHTVLNCQPIYDKSVVKLIDDVYSFITKTIWIESPDLVVDLINSFDSHGANDIIKLSNMKAVLETGIIDNLYNQYKDDPKVIFNNSIRKRLGIKPLLIKKSNHF